MAWVMQDPKAMMVTLSLIIYESVSYESILSPPRGRMREHSKVFAKKKKKRNPHNAYKSGVTLSFPKTS